MPRDRPSVVTGRAARKISIMRVPSPFRSSATVVLIVAVIVRAGVLWGVPGGLAEDVDSYAAVADNLLHHGVFGYGDRATAFRPPLYPILLATCRSTGLPWIGSAGAAHLLLALATVALSIGLARRLGLGEQAWIAGLLVICDPILLFHSRLLMTETLSAALVTAALWMATEAARRSTGPAWFLAGVLLGLNALTRPTFLPWIAVAVAVVLIVGQHAACAECLPPRPGERRSARLFPSTWAWREAALTALGALAVLSPWAARNAILFGRPILGTTHGGYTLYLANNPDYYAYLWAGRRDRVWDSATFDRHWKDELHAAHVTDEPAADRLAYSLARRTIATQPGTFLRACVQRLASFWGVLPHDVLGEESVSRRAARYLVAVFYTIEFVAAICGTWSLFVGRREGWHGAGHPPHRPDPAEAGSRGGGREGKIAVYWAAAAVLILTLAHLFYWTNMRMRAPIMPVIAIAAAAGMRLPVKPFAPLSFRAKRDTL